MTTDHENILQRLADGELEPDALHGLLLQAEAEPILWREMALTFIENHALKEEFATLFPTEQRDRLPAPARPPAGPSRRARVWAHAAGLLFMLTLGLIAGRQWANEAASPRYAPTLSPSGSGSETPTFTEGSGYRLIVETPSGERESEVINLPAYDESTLREAARQSTAHGWAVNWQTDLWSGKLGDGRRLVVPVSLPRISYLGQ